MSYRYDPKYATEKKVDESLILLRQSYDVYLK
ncbi:Uncharacterised protein [Yokenella regensburgei]|uniref:Uncharacterized protein n=1 Tax=Yokenella regensburgei TaxID=158877 RepID=A0AB38FXV7_9ENTR|nr:Uncharacterised protein [Yokenella regensburgei]SQB02225.1 Uncharacterised protein [Yokenella regensburgei]SUQ07474.1 Uncharacterised protein [Yokenella regensburgei]